MGLNCISISKVMVVWIGSELSCSISSVSIYYVPESDIHVKCYDHMNFSRFAVFQFRVSWYILGLNRTPMSKVMAVWIAPELSCSISTVSIYYAPKSDIRVKSYDHLNFSRFTIFQFRESWYIMCFNRTSKWNAMTILISWELPFFYFEPVDISWASILHPCQKLWLSELDQSVRVEFWASRYIMCLNQTSEWNVRTIWIFRELPIFNFDRLYISCASIVLPCQKLWPSELH